MERNKRPRARCSRSRGFWLVVFAITIAIAAMPLLAEAASNRIQPTKHAGSAKIKTGRKSYTYHRATVAKPIEFQVTGPTPLRILSRYLYASGQTPKSVSYRLVVEIDGVPLPSEAERGKVSKSTWKGRPVATLEREVIRIPAGNHRVVVKPVNPRANVAVRIFLGTGEKTRVAWIDFTPETYERSLRLHRTDQEIACYRVTSGVPVEMPPIHGPLRLRVETRIDFGYANGYTQSYIVKALLDGKPWRSFALKSRASHTTTYPDMPEVTPGLVRQFEVEVPPGTHNVRFELDGTTAGGASLRVRAPRDEINEGIRRAG